MRNLLLPPILWLVAIAAMVLSHERYPIVHWEASTPRTAVGLMMIVAAIATTVWHKRLFRKVGTNVETFGNPDQLVEGGLFRHIRNPMYLGFVASLASLALLSGALSAWLIAFAFFLVTDRWYIPFEEKAMLARFGLRYEEYRARTRRWV